MKVLTIAGARPNFMKVAPLMRQFLRSERIQPILVHTGQHYDVRMSDVFFRDLDIPEPAIHLGVGSGSHARQTAEVMTRFDDVLESEKPDLVLVVGDVNSTLACSVAAAKRCIPVAHVEAGLRSFDRTMPEEINRIVTDSLSGYLFTTESSGNENLLREGHDPASIHFTGNVMIDSLVFATNRMDSHSASKQFGVRKGSFAVVTIHRPSNVDDKDSFRKVLDILDDIQKGIEILFPIHPRSRKMLTEHGFTDRVQSMRGLRLLEPLGYLEFLSLVKDARFVLTDSGGIQEETTFLGVPCLTMRENTERPVTESVGTNTLVGTDVPKIHGCYAKIMDGTYKKGSIPPLWDGQAAERICSVLEKL